MVFGFGKITIEKVEKMGKKKDVKGLIKALNHEDDEVRIKSAKALINVGDSQAVEPLIKSLKDKNSTVVTNSSIALRKIGGVKTVNSLINLLNDENDDVKSIAIYDLGELGNKKAVEPLKNVLNDKNLKNRIDVAEALLKLDDSYGVDVLRDALQDQSSYTRLRAVNALGKSHGKKALQPMFIALKDNDHRVREKALESIDKMGWKPYKTKDEAYYLTVKGNFNSLIEMGDVAIEPIVEIILKEVYRYGKDETWESRMNASRVLGEIGGEKAVEGLLIALKDPNSRVRYQSLISLNKICEGKEVPINATETLLKMLTNETTLNSRRIAAEMLIQIYNQNSTNSEIKEKILNNKTIFTRKHEDHYDCPQSSDCSNEHADTGIGIDF